MAASFWEFAKAGLAPQSGCSFSSKSGEGAWAAEDAAPLGEPEASPHFSSSSLLRVFRPGSALPALIAGVTLNAHAVEWGS